VEREVGGWRFDTLPTSLLSVFTGHAVTHRERDYWTIAQVKLHCQECAWMNSLVSAHAPGQTNRRKTIGISHSSSDSFAGPARAHECKPWPLLREMMWQEPTSVLAFECLSYLQVSCAHSCAAPSRDVANGICLSESQVKYLCHVSS
jgi:hypothetical protein